MEVENEMDIFITLTKYNTRQGREEGKPLLVVYYLISMLNTNLTIESNVYMRFGTYPLLFIGTIYNQYEWKKCFKQKIAYIWAIHVFASKTLGETNSPWSGSGYSVPQWSGRPGFNPRSRHTKDYKNGTWYLLV